MINISKEDFCDYITRIENYRYAESELSDIISRYGDAYFIFNPGWNVIYALIKLLGELTNSKESDAYGNDIDYYLFEESKKVWLDNTEYDISTPEKLYDYLVVQDEKSEENNNG